MVSNGCWGGTNSLQEGPGFSGGANRPFQMVMRKGKACLMISWGYVTVWEKKRGEMRERNQREKEGKGERLVFLIIIVRHGSRAILSFCWLTHLSVCLFANSPTYLSICLLTHPPICLSVFQSHCICLYLSIFFLQLVSNTPKWRMTDTESRL